MILSWRRGIKTYCMKTSELQYRYASRRVEELLRQITDTTLLSAPEKVELSIMTAFVEQYEAEHCKIEKLTLAEVIKQGLRAKGMTQKELAERVGLSTTRISDFTNGRSEPTLATAGLICKVLDLMPEAMLGL